MKRGLFALFAAILVMASFSARGQDFVYQAKNPAFGGSYLNYSWMLNSANAQNTLKDPSASDGYGYSGYQYDPFADFEQDIQRRFFSELSSQIINSYFGEDGTRQEGLEEGSYRFGNYSIDINPGQQGINITIKDFAQGSESTITIPYY